MEIGFELRLDVADAELRVWQHEKAAAPAGVVDVTTYGPREDGVCLLFIPLWFHFGPLVGVRLGYTPGVFAKSVEVVWNEGIAKLAEIESVEVAGGTGLAGGPSVERVRRGDFHIS